MIETIFTLLFLYLIKSYICSMMFDEYGQMKVSMFQYASGQGLCTFIISVFFISPIIGAWLAILNSIAVFILTKTYFETKHAYIQKSKIWSVIVEPALNYLIIFVTIQLTGTMA